jgi:hypothetical protein
MTNDLVKRLRDHSLDGTGRISADVDLMEAADRIEQLEQALREIADPESWEGMDWVSYGVPKLIARAALEKKIEQRTED